MEIVCVLIFALSHIHSCELSKFNELAVNIRHAKKKDLAGREDHIFNTYSYNEYDDYTWASSSVYTTEYDSSTTEISLSSETEQDAFELYTNNIEISEEENFNYNMKEDVVTKFLRIVESQHELGDNCTAGTDLNLGEGVVDRYAQVCINECFAFSVYL